MNMNIYTNITDRIISFTEITLQKVYSIICVFKNINRKSEHISLSPTPIFKSHEGIDTQITGVIYTGMGYGRCKVDGCFNIPTVGIVYWESIVCDKHTLSDTMYCIIHDLQSINRVEYINTLTRDDLICILQS